MTFNDGDLLYASQLNQLAVKSELSSGDGSKSVGWERDMLSDASDSVSSALNSISVSIWEFSNLITSKDDPLNPATWDWSPATSAAIDQCIYFLSIPIGSSTRYSSAELIYPPGKYRHDSPINKDLSGITYETGKPAFRITCHGSLLSSNIDRQYLLTLTGGLVWMKDVSFTKENGVYAYYLKLGDESVANSKAVGGRFTNLRMLSPTKGLTFGQCYDAIFDGLYMTGFVVPDDMDLSNPATGIHVLQHVSDNTNNLVFLRPHIETTNTANYRAILINGNGHSSAHHNIRVYGGHIETHLRGVTPVEVTQSGSFPSVHGLTLDGLIVTENGSNAFPAATNNLVSIAGGSLVSFDHCIVQTNNLASVSFNSSIHKPIIKLSGGYPSIIFRDTAITTSFSTTSSANDLSTVFDVTGHSSGTRAYVLDELILNDFKRPVSTGPLISAKSASTRKYILESSDGNNLSILYGNLDDGLQSMSSILSVSNDGTTNFLKQMFIGLLEPSAATRLISLYPLTDKTKSVDLSASTGGNLTIKTINDVYLTTLATGVGRVLTGMSIMPSVAGGASIGSLLLPFAGGWFQNAPLVGVNPVATNVPVPATATSTGVIGQIASDENFMYVCTAVNTWKRVAIATW